MKVFKKIGVLYFTILFLINIYAPVYSYYNGNSGVEYNISLSNETEQAVTNETIYEPLITSEELNDIVANTNNFSDLSESEQEQVKDNYMVNKEKMEMCEDAGYSISESLDISKILQNTGITIEQINDLINLYGDSELAISEAKKFSNYRYTHASSGITYDTVCIDYLISGISAGNILKARAMADFIGCNIEESSEFGETETDYDDDIDAVAQMFCTKRSSIDEYIRQNNLSEDDFLNEVEILYPILDEAGDSVSQFSLGGTNSLYDPENYPAAPFTYDRNSTEVINEQTGSVGYKETDAVIKGKNGLDLVIGVRYDSADAERSVITADSSGFGTITRRDTTIKKKMYSPMVYFAPGWEFSTGYIKFYVNGFNDVYSAIVDRNGNTRSIKRQDVESADVTELRLYDGKIDIYDLRLYKDSSYSDNGVTSMFCAKYDDGRTEYFDEQGKLMK
ncbi:MAG: hypothetical protein ACI4DY_03775, partial [Monoglobaceae bacterium]